MISQWMAVSLKRCAMNELNYSYICQFAMRTIILCSISFSSQSEMVTIPNPVDGSVVSSGTNKIELLSLINLCLLTSQRMS